MSQIISKIGIHCVGGTRNGYGAFLQTVNNAGRKLSLVKCRDDFGAIDEPLLYWPDTLCIGAFTEFDGFPFDFNAFKARALLNPKIKVWEVLNEINGMWSEQADLYISLAPLFAAQGWSLCMFNCASGTPPLPDEDGGIAYREIARACKWMKDHGYTAYLCLHEYETLSMTIGRFAFLADYLEAQGALIPIVITEYGFETHPGDATLLDFVEAHDYIYMADPRVVGCALWTLGGGGWAGSNYQTALPALGDYIATVAPITPPGSWAFEHYHLDGGAAITDNPMTIVMDRAHTLIVNVVKVAADRFLLTVTIDPPEARVEVVLTPPQLPEGYLIGQAVEIFTRPLP